MTPTKIFGFVLLFPFCVIADVSVFVFAHGQTKSEFYQSFTSILLDATLDPSK